MATRPLLLVELGEVVCMVFVAKLVSNRTMIPAIRKWQLTNPTIILSKLLSGGYTN